jgi:class 3 adenylate cyclase
LTVDAQLDDGGGQFFPVKGREIDAAVLFADISEFSRRTQNLQSTETLIFANQFFAWITAEALGSSPGIIDKYIGDEIMIVYSKEFGSADPFIDALTAARRMGEYDPFAFSPHIGIATGRVTVGYVGTSKKYSCSVFGAPVALAARCASVRPDHSMAGGDVSSHIVFPAEAWDTHEFHVLFPARNLDHPTRGVQIIPTPWELLDTREVEFKNLGNRKGWFFWRTNQYRGRVYNYKSW